jgi:hypothetical protein
MSGVIVNSAPAAWLSICGEPYFTWHYNLYTGAPYRGGDVVDYRALEA